MKQIIPFVKDLSLSTKISEITSIALEHNLSMENDDSIVGSFTISGKYKINDISVNEEVFEKVVPFDITLDDKYDASKVQIDIDDFYYEIINDEYLRVHIDVKVNNLVYLKKETEEPKEELETEEITNVVFADKVKDEPISKENINRGDEREMNKEEKEVTVTEDIENKEENATDVDSERNQNLVNNLSSGFLNSEEKYVCYKVHIVRDNETVEQIKEKYEVTDEELAKYNDLENIVLGTKLIIPSNK